MFPAMNKTPHAKLTHIKRTHWVTKQEYSNSHQLPEKTSTKYRGSLTLRSPHTRRNRCKLSVSAGMPATNDCKNHSFMQIKKLQTAPRMSTRSGKSRNRVDCEKWSFLPLFLALAATLRENFHHFIGHRCLFAEQWMCSTWRKIWWLLELRAQPGGPWAALGASLWFNPKKNNCIHLKTPHLLQIWDLVNQFG